MTVFVQKIRVIVIKMPIPMTWIPILLRRIGMEMKLKLKISLDMELEC
jgi:hypothetical protein